MAAKFKLATDKSFPNTSRNQVKELSHRERERELPKKKKKESYQRKHAINFPVEEKDTRRPN